MANTISTTIPPYEGEYEIVRTADFTHVEWRWVKKISGYMPLTIAKGWAGGDVDLVLAMLVIAMRRAGKIEKHEVMAVAEHIEDAAADGESISINLEEDEEAVDDSPPEESGDDEKSNLPSDSPPDSGEVTSDPSEHSPESTSPSGTGVRGLDTGAASDHLTLAK